MFLAPWLLINWFWNPRHWAIDFKRLRGEWVGPVKTREGWMVLFGPVSIAIYTDT